MAIARGSRSSLAWKEEVTYGVAPTGNWNSFPINSETLDENINTVQGQDIRPDRANPSLRGGNITTGGTIVSDFGPLRNLTFMKHMLAATVVSTPLTVNVPASADSTAYVIGNIVSGASGTWACTTAGTSGTGLNAALTGTGPITSGSAVFTKVNAAADSTAYVVGQVVTNAANNSRWIVTIGGTSSTGLAAALIGSNNVTSGTVTFKYLVSTLMPSVSYSRGVLVMDASSNFWTCTRGGTTNASVVSSNLSGTGEVTIAGSGSTTLKFQYLAASTVKIYKHVLTPGASWPAGGISIEKGVVGGTVNQYTRWNGCRVDSLELSVPQEGIVRSTWSILSASSTDLLTASGAGAPVLVGESPYTGFNCFVGLNDSVGNTDRAVRDFSMTITNQADGQAFVIGSRFRADIPEGIRRASGRLSMYFQDHQEYGWFKNETTIQMIASLIWNGKMIEFNFGEVKLTGSGAPKISGAGLMTADFDWTAFLETGTNDVIVTAINDSATLP